MGKARNSIIARNGLGLVGLALFAFGIVEAGVGVAQYLRPALTSSEKIDVAVTKAVAFHDASVGVAAMIVGLVLGIAGVLRNRALARANARDFVPSEQPSTPAEPPAPHRVIDLDAPNRLEQMPVTPEADVAPIAERVWQYRLAVDLQQQRILKEGIGAESKIDGELYVLSLHNLILTVKEAQVQTRSLAIWEAITTFGTVAGDGEEFVSLLEQADLVSHRSDSVQFDPAGTLIRIGRFEIPATRLTAAADQLANTTVGDLSNIRARAVQNSYSKNANTRP